MSTTPRTNGWRKPSTPPCLRGRLKIFVGYASGVGKTFRMLDEARRRKERGEDVIVAGCQPGAEAETRTLLDRFETIPILRTSLGEGLHMDAILRRRPNVCVIDPLAHNNPAGFRNAKRWQDIEELLEKSISVLTAINLLHIEELSERVEAITGKHTKETVPREFLAHADEIVVVDAPTDLVLERSSKDSGLPDASQEPARKLSELREMTLVLAAELAEGQLERYLAAHGIQTAWGAHERILVCLTPQSNGEAMISSGKRNRERFHGELHVVYVRQPRLSSADRTRMQRLLEMARAAGAVVHTLPGDDPVATILDYARQNKITQIFVGHSRRDDWLSRFGAGPLDRLLRAADQIDVRIFPQ